MYFTARVFWRGWVFDWSPVSGYSGLQFPSEIGLAFIAFLLHKEPFSSSVVLQVEVAVNPLAGSGNPTSCTGAATTLGRAQPREHRFTKSPSVDGSSPGILRNCP